MKFCYFFLGFGFLDRCVNNDISAVFFTPEHAWNSFWDFLNEEEVSDL